MSCCCCCRYCCTFIKMVKQVSFRCHHLSVSHTPNWLYHARITETIWYALCSFVAVVFTYSHAPQLAEALFVFVAKTPSLVVEILCACKCVLSILLLTFVGCSWWRCYTCYLCLIVWPNRYIWRGICRWLYCVLYGSEWKMSGLDLNKPPGVALL